MYSTTTLKSNQITPLLKSSVSQTTVNLSGINLSIADIALVAGGLSVTLNEQSLARMARTHALVHQAITRGTSIYGVTRGLGLRAEQTLSSEEINAFSLATIRGRAHALGAPLSIPVVRAAMAIRVNGLLSGASGASPNLATHLAACLNANLVPHIGDTHSIGAGDLIWGASMALALCGEGRFLHQPDAMSASDMLSKAGIRPLNLGPRDGLALTSHASFTTAFAALAHAQANTLWYSAQTAAALSLEAFRANLSPFRKDVLALRAQPGIADAADDLAQRLEGSTLYKPGAARRLQDPLSFRNLLQVHGSVRAALDSLEQTIIGEMNGASDNPVVLEKTAEIVSSGNFLNAHLAVVLVAANYSLLQLAAQMNARITKLLANRFTDLPSGLIGNQAAAAGLMPLTKLSEALYAEIAQRAAAPPVYLSISADGIEDTATHAALIARNMLAVNQALAKLLAIELVVATQAIELRQPNIELPSRLISKLKQVRAACPKITIERPLSLELSSLSNSLLTGAFAD